MSVIGSTDFTQQVEAIVTSSVGNNLPGTLFTSMAVLIASVTWQNNMNIKSAVKLPFDL
jgi:hypothetical protein